MDTPTPITDAARGIINDLGDFKFDRRGDIVPAETMADLERALTAERTAHDATRAELAADHDAHRIALGLLNDAIAEGRGQNIALVASSVVHQLCIVTAERDHNAAALEQAIRRIEAMEAVLRRRLAGDGSGGPCVGCQAADCADCLARRVMDAGKGDK